MTRLCRIIPVEAMATRLLGYEINVPLGLCGKVCDLSGLSPISLVTLAGMLYHQAGARGGGKLELLLPLPPAPVQQCIHPYLSV